MSWNASVELSPACREEVRVRWWLWNLCPVNGRAICPHPGPARIDSHVFADSSDTGAGAVILLEGPEAAASSVVQALRPMAPLDVSHDELIERASRGIEFKFMTAFHPLVRDDCSTLREMWGMLAFVMAAGCVLLKDHKWVVMENLGCVFITGGAATPFAVGGKRSDKFVSGDHLALRCRPWQ